MRQCLVENVWIIDASQERISGDHCEGIGVALCLHKTFPQGRVVFLSLTLMHFVVVQ